MYTMIKHRFLHATALVLGCGVLLWSCGASNEDPKAAAEEMPLFYEPEGFPKPMYGSGTPVVTEKGFELGRRLFYDGKLSRDGSVACANCHIQASAFSHHGHDISHGIDDKLGNRNAPALQNLAWIPEFFWDGGVHDLDLFALAPLENPVEMDEKLPNVLQKLRNDTSYKKQFKEVFGSDEITTVHFLKALSQFQLALISANSRYDLALKGKTTLTNDEKEGSILFQKKCSSCHEGSLFTDNSFRNNGLELYLRDTDKGRYNVTLQDNDRYKYKVPSLRNVAVTAPYMHDGRFRSLEAVLKHYQKEVQKTPNLDGILQKNEKLGIELTDTESAKIIAFLKTLTDETFLTDKRFSEMATTVIK